MNFMCNVNKIWSPVDGYEGERVLKSLSSAAECSAPSELKQ